MRRYAQILIALVFAADVQAQEIVSVAGDGSQAQGRSEAVSVSANGRFVAFESNAPNFVTDDQIPSSSISSATDDVFVADLQTGMVELISVGLDGRPANASRKPAISGDGRYVVFQSFATNLVLDDNNELEDIFLFDRDTRTTVRVNLSPDGAEANDRSDDVAISDDGRFVAFESTASNLVLNDTNERRDIFVWSRESGVTERVNMAHNGDQPDELSDSPSLSADGRYVVFESRATNLVPGDTNMHRDIFLRDRELNLIERIDVAFDGTQSDDASEKPSVSADGRLVLFDSVAKNLITQALPGRSHIFLKDRQTGLIELISRSTEGVPADEFCEEAAMTADARLITFDCPATTLVDTATEGGENIYIYDRASQEMKILSTTSDGVPGNAGSNRPSISGDAIAFTSFASNLVPNDNNDEPDVFVVRLPIFADNFESMAQR